MGKRREKPVTPAEKIIRHREKIRKIIAKSSRQGKATAGQLKMVESITHLIEIEKDKIRKSGLDPEQMISAMIAHQREEQRNKRNKITGRRHGGLGIYGLGASLKLWR